MKERIRKAYDIWNEEKHLSDLLHQDFRYDLNSTYTDLEYEGELLAEKWDFLNRLYVWAVVVKQNAMFPIRLTLYALFGREKEWFESD